MIFVLSQMAWGQTPMPAVPVPPVTAMMQPLVFEVGTELLFPLLGTHVGMMSAPEGSILGLEIHAETGLSFAAGQIAGWIRSPPDTHRGFHLGLRGGVRIGTGYGIFIFDQDISGPFVGGSLHGQIAHGYGDRFGTLSFTAGATRTAFLELRNRLEAPGSVLPDVTFRVDSPVSDRSGLYLAVGVPQIIAFGVTVYPRALPREAPQ